MTKILNGNALVFGIPLLLIASLLVLMQSQVFQAHPTELARGITLDLLLTIPIVYFLLIRKKKNIPNITVLSSVVIGLLLASLILPVEQQGLLETIKLFAIPLIELTVVSFIIYKTRQIIKGYAGQDTEHLDFFDALHSACTTAFPAKLAKLLATEIAMVYYLFKPKAKRGIADNEFTYYKKNGIMVLVGTFIGLILVETAIVHLLVERWNVVVAWVLSGFSLYSCLQITSLLRSMPQRLMKIDQEKGILYLRYGYFSQTTIQINEIASIENSKKSLPDDTDVVRFSPLGSLDNHNLIVRLHKEHVLHGIYGTKKDYSALAFHVDEVDRFLEKMESAQA